MSSSAPQAIVSTFDRVPAHLVAKASEFQPAILADVAGRRGALHARIKALHPGMRVAGPAFTVDVRPGDNLMIHAAMALAQPGDVLVIDGKNDLTAALMGEIMMTVCQERKIAGVVIDGSVRDSAQLASMNFPVFACGTNPNGPTKNIAGRIGHPISIGGVSVHAGDFVSGDADGVVIVPRLELEGLLGAAEKKVSDESKRIAAIKKGDTNASWLDSALRAAGIEL